MSIPYTVRSVSIPWDVDSSRLARTMAAVEDAVSSHVSSALSEPLLDGESFCFFFSTHRFTTTINDRR